MQDSMDRKLYRKTWMIGFYWMAAVSWLVTVIIDVVTTGKPGVVHVALVLMWSVLALQWTQPLAVTNADRITLKNGFRPRAFAWNQIVSFKEFRPGVGTVRLSDGSELTVPFADARVKDQEYLRKVLLSKGIAADAV